MLMVHPIYKENVIWTEPLFIWKQTAAFLSQETNTVQIQQIENSAVMSLVRCSSLCLVHPLQQHCWCTQMKEKKKGEQPLISWKQTSSTLEPRTNHYKWARVSMSSSCLPGKKHTALLSTHPKATVRMHPMIKRDIETQLLSLSEQESGIWNLKSCLKQILQAGRAAGMSFRWCLFLCSMHTLQYLWMSSQVMKTGYRNTSTRSQRSIRIGMESWKIQYIDKKWQLATATLLEWLSLLCSVHTLQQYCWCI